MIKILITGANSFIGSHYFKLSNHSVVNEVSLIKNKPKDIEFSGIDVVLHVAGIVHQIKSIHEEIYYQVNTNITTEVAKLAKEAGVKQFVFMSTVKVYGEFKEGMKTWNEETECMPEDNYGKSKFKAEQELMKLNCNDFIVSIIRTPLVYGDGVKANMANIIKLVQKFPILPLNKIHNKRSFTYIGNLVAFIDRIVELKICGVFIVKDESEISTTELVLLIAKYMNKKLILFKMPDFIISTGKKIFPKIFYRLFGSFELENNHTLKILDFHPPYSTEDGIRKMVNNLMKKKQK
jgi:nucleoside-diphosphate-sugar epimerase